MKTLAIIGSTGSIGKSSLKVFKKNKKKFKLIYLLANNNCYLLNRQIKKYKPKNFYLLNKKKHSKLLEKKKLKSLNNLIQSKKKIDYVISGVSGYESLNLNFKLLKISKNLLIANKETIICGGDIFLNQAKKSKCKIIPIDSEHHCLNLFFDSFKDVTKIKKIFLIASGGPFLDKKIKINEKIKDVVKHPTWKMGTKISIDSSTLANKVLELFEAKFLFNLKKTPISILIEKKSNLHAVVLLKNNISFLITHKPSMEIPIANSLDCLNADFLKLENLNLNLLKPNYKKFPIVKLGYKILNMSHGSMIMFTVLNERIVNQYTGKKIKYGEISKKLVAIFNNKKIVKKVNKCIKNTSDIFKIINYCNSIKI